MGTVRQQIIALLQEEELNILELSQLVRIREKEVGDHLEHIGKSLKHVNLKLLYTPYCCLSCGYSFKDRRRSNRPGRCPSCKGSHIRMATYFIKPC
ncbi:MAG: transcriptional regulator [Thermodesulfobacteriota bacterium]